MNNKRIKSIICATLAAGMINGLFLNPVMAMGNNEDGNVEISSFGEIRTGTLDSNFEINEERSLSDSYARIQEADTKIAMSATINTKINSEVELSKALDNNKIGGAILFVDRNLNIIGEGNNLIGTLEDVYENIEGRLMPIIKIEDESGINNLVEFINNREIEDLYITSSNKELVKEVRNLVPMARGIIEFNLGKSGDLTREELMEIVANTNSNASKVALLPEELLTRNNVEFLQKKLITVWGTSKDDKISTHKVITSGVNGIISQNPEEVINSLESYNGNDTIIRHQFIIGHRGIPSLAPENTMSGYKKAFELGADVLETDIYLTKDNQIVIMHDGTIDRTTTGTGNVEDYTMAELKEFYANDQFPEAYPDERIPSLEEMLDEFKAKDVDIFVEVKSYKPEIISVLVDLLKEKDMVDQVSIITFSDAQAKLMREAMPEISVGYLSSAGNNGKPYDYLRNTLKTIQPMGTTFNTSYAMLNKEYLNIAKQRGLTMWPWTYRKEADLAKHFTMGIHGLTTDYTQWISNKELRIDGEKSEYNLTINGVEEVNGITTDYIGNENNVQGEIVVIEGGENIEVNGNQVKGIKSGEAYVQIKYTGDMLGKPYDIYSEPIKVRVEEEVNVDKVKKLKAEEVGNESLNLVWEKSDKASGITEYVIYKDGEEIATVPSEYTSYKVEGLKSNSIYGFKVTSRYSNGEESKPTSINVRTTK
ncbi:glycerophosphodiester phosphodiesterase family protein [Clostridium sp.]|uniref:glycerophosphodiester phosphodiesterase family protein n=1 Tax=Clostridium sp. TaxID=1506 RepID=UPI003F36A323